MHELPFLVVHGGVIAMLLVLASAGSASGAVWLVRRVRDRRRAGRELRERARAATALAAPARFESHTSPRSGSCWFP